MKMELSKARTKTGLLIAVVVLALSGCATAPVNSARYRPQAYNSSGPYDGYVWNDYYGPYFYGPYLGFGYGWIPDEDGWDNGFIGGGEDMFGDDDEGPGQ